MFSDQIKDKVTPFLISFFLSDRPSLSGVFDRGYNERSGVIPVLDETGAEDRVEALVERMGEGVEVQTDLHVVEGDLASFVIQEDSHFGGLRLQHERHASRRQGLHLPALQPQAPVSPLRAQLDLTLAAGRAACNAERPGHLAARVHLPVVAPRAQTLSAQDEEGRAEALGTLRVGGLALFVPHLATVFGHDQVPLGRCGIQYHLTWRESRAE